MTDKQILKMVSDFKNGLLSKRNSDNMCYAVCAPLQAFLELSGIECYLVEGSVDLKDCSYGHYWIELEDGRIIDPTADQFNKHGTTPKFPSVYIGELPAQYEPVTQPQ